MSQSSDRILAAIGRLTLEGRLPSDKAELSRVLIESGFDADEVRAAVTGNRTPAPDEEGRPTPILQLSDQATRLLNSLRDLGYLDDAAEDEVLDALLDEGHTVADLDAVRRHVAAVLFDRRADLDAEMQRYLEEEWRLAFH